MKKLSLLVKKRDAFTLIELIIGMTILAVVLVITLTSFSKQLELSIENKQKTLATTAARDQLEYLRSIEANQFDNIVTGDCTSVRRPPGGTNPTWQSILSSQYPGLVYVAASTSQNVANDPTSSSLKTVKVVVTYNSPAIPGGQNSVSMSTYIRK